MTPDMFVERTKARLSASLERLFAPLDGPPSPAGRPSPAGPPSPAGRASPVDLLAPGKMLRTRLAAHLVCATGMEASEALEAACVGTELIHTASLCHDDIIDRAAMRRGRPALWRVDGPTVAVLLGDMLICEAFAQVGSACEGRHVRAFAACVQEVCQAEAEQELLLGRQLDEATYLRMARSMTGPLFAFPACVCGGEDPALGAALDEAGYRIGAAYQVADDLLDVAGSEQSAGKTLGTDATRRKFTLAGATPDGGGRARRRVVELCRSALQVLEPWPAMRGALNEFYATELQPVFDRCVKGLEIGGG